MSKMVAVAECPVHLERLEKLQPSPAKAHLKEREMEWRSRVGSAIASAIKSVGLTLKEAAALIGRDVAQVARWISGAERPQFDALFAVEVLRGPLVIALAGLAHDIEITTTIAIRRTA